MIDPAPIQLDPAFDNVWDELQYRGSVHVSTDPEALRTLLGGDPITFYCGFDPTAPSLHLGNLAQLIVMRRLQLAGHRPLALVGGSTGLIGVGDEVFRAAVLRGVDLTADALADDDAAGLAAAQAIMTTDSKPKQAVVTTDGFTVGGMAKGAGMLAPGLATMLVVLTTDAEADADVLDRALRAATSTTFDRLDSDGCMSTNDTVLLLASGASGARPDEAALTAAVTAVCDDLAAQLHGDAEGATHDIAIEVRSAASEQEAVVVARSVARSNLFKAAIFGNDPNWGRVLAAIGTTDASFDPYAVDVHFNGVRVCHAGEPDRPREEVDLTPRATHILIDLFAGDATATVRTNDLTHDYVHENSAYAS